MMREREDRLLDFEAEHARQFMIQVAATVIAFLVVALVFRRRIGIR